MQSVAIAAALLLPGFATHAEPAQLRPQVGDTYELRRDKEFSQHASDGSSASSSDQDVIVERVVALREAGLELQYDLPRDATAQDRLDNWQFPVRVFKPARGPLQLLNQSELEARVDPWLKTAGLSRAACGRWIFTWNAFRIECDPQSAIRALEPFDMGPADLREGALYRDPKAGGQAALARRTITPGGATFIVEMAADPDAVRREQAESDVAVAEMSRKTLPLEAALRARSAEEISGTITITFDTDSIGRVWRRTKITKLETKRPGGRVEDQTVTETLERRPIARRHS
ncbi:MAG: hypothetical protein ACHP7A_06500 [Caulobacterales bacterium]